MLQLKNDYLRGPTENAVVTPDGTRLIANSDNTMQVYNIANAGKPVLIQEFKYAGIIHSHGPTESTFLACNNNCFASAQLLQGVIIVNILSGTSYRFIPTDSSGHATSVNGAAITGNILILACSDAIRIYDITIPTNPSLKTTINTMSVGVYTNGTRIVSVNNMAAQVFSFTGAPLYSTTHLYTIDTSQQAYQYLAYSSTSKGYIYTTYLNEITSVVFIGNQVIIGCNSGCIFSHDVNGNFIKFYPADKYASQTQVKLAVSNGKILAGLHDVYFINLIDPASNIVISNFNEGSLIGGYITGIFAFNKGSVSYFVVACEYRGFGIINVSEMTASGNEGLQYKSTDNGSANDSHGSISAAVLNPDGNLVYASDDFALRTVDMSTGNDFGVIDYNARGSGNLEYDASRQLIFRPGTWNGLEIIDVSNKNSPKSLFTKKYYSNDCDAVKIIGTNRLLMSAFGILVLLDTTTSSNPTELSHIDSGFTDITFLEIDPSGTYAYGASSIVVNDQTQGVIVVFKITRDTVSKVKTINTPYTINKVVAVGNRLYVSVYTVGLQIYDITDTSNPKYLSTYDPYETCDGLFALNTNIIYAGMAEAPNIVGHLMKLDMTTPSNPIVIDNVAIPNAEITTIDVKGITVLANLYDQGMLTFTDTDMVTVKYGILVINSTPAGADIIINGLDLSLTTPQTFDTVYSLGTFPLTLRLSGYYDYNTSFTVIAGQTTTLNLTLTKVQQTTGTLNISSTPSGAALFVDGTNIGTTPGAIPLQVGLHSYRLSLAGYHDYIASVNITGGHTITINATLSPVPVPCPKLTIPVVYGLPGSVIKGQSFDPIISWSGGTPGYWVRLIADGNPSSVLYDSGGYNTISGTTISPSISTSSLSVRLHTFQVYVFDNCSSRQEKVSGLYYIVVTGA